MTYWKTAFVLVFALFVSAAYSQDLVDQIAQETCDCVSKKNIDNLSEEELQMELGMCMMTSLTSRPEALSKLGLDITDQAAMTQFGEKVGMKMVAKCPAILMKMGAMTTETSTEVSQRSQLQGKIKGFAGDEFRYLLVVDGSGREHRLLWLRYFPGSEQLANNADQLIGKTVTVTFEELECWSPQVKEYINRKEIRGLTFRNE